MTASRSQCAWVGVEHAGTDENGNESSREWLGDRHEATKQAPPLMDLCSGLTLGGDPQPRYRTGRSMPKE